MGWPERVEHSVGMGNAGSLPHTIDACTCRRGAVVGTKLGSSGLGEYCVGVCCFGVSALAFGIYLSGSVNGVHTPLDSLRAFRNCMGLRTLWLPAYSSLACSE